MTLYRRTGDDIDRGLVGYWPLNDLRRVVPDGICGHFKLNDNAASTTVIDSAKGENGTANANTSTLTTTALVAGAAFDFNGSTQITLNHAVSELGTKFAVSFWVNLDTSDTNFRTILNGGWQKQGAFTSFYYNGNFSFQMRDTSNNLISVSNPLSTATTYHIAVTGDGTTVRLYVNGVEESTDTYSEAVNYVSDSMVVGGTTNDLDGRLDDLRLYCRSLSSSEVATIYNSGSGTETTELFRNTVVARDLANFNDGTISGCTNTDGVNGVSPDAMLFDGVDDKITFADLGYGATDPRTVSCWFKLNSDGTNVFNSHVLVVTDYLYMHVRNTTNAVTFRYDYGSAVAPSYELGSGDTDWHQAVGTYQKIGSTNYISIYVDGVLRSTLTDANNPASSYSGEGGIGNRTSEYLDGNVQNVRIYDRALTDGEIKKLFRLKK